MTFKSISCAVLVTLLTTWPAPAIENVGAFRVSQPVGGLMDKYCFSCHDADEHKGDIRLDNLDSLALDARLDLLNRVQEQLFFGEMPPKKKSSLLKTSGPRSWPCSRRNSARTTPPPWRTNCKSLNLATT